MHASLVISVPVNVLLRRNICLQVTSLGSEEKLGVDFAELYGQSELSRYL